MRAHGVNRLLGRADTCREHRKHLPTDLDIGLDRLETLSQCASDEAQSTSPPYTPAQPKHQIPISNALHIAGSFLGDFPTPDGVRNSYMRIVKAIRRCCDIIDSFRDVVIDPAVESIA